MRGRFGRRRRRDGGDAGRAPIDIQWLERVREADLLPLETLEPGESPVPEWLARVGTGTSESGERWQVAVSPSGGGDAVLAALLLAAAAPEPSEAGDAPRPRLAAVSPIWRERDRRRLAAVAETLPLRALALPASGEVPREAPLVRLAPQPLAQLAAQLETTAQRALARRALDALQGLAAKHGGALRAAGDAAELVLQARPVARLRVGPGGPELEALIPTRSALPLAGDALADAFDRLEGQLRKRLGDRKVQASEEGLRARAIAALAGTAELRQLRRWPVAGEDPAVLDAIALDREGRPVLAAIRERLDLASLAPLIDAALAMPGTLSGYLDAAEPPLRAAAPRLLLAATEYDPAALAVLSHMAVPAALYDLREGTPPLVIARGETGVATEAQPLPAAASTAARPARAEEGEARRSRDRSDEGEARRSRDRSDEGEARRSRDRSDEGDARRSRDRSDEGDARRSRDRSDEGDARRSRDRDREDEDETRRSEDAESRRGGRSRRRRRRGGRGRSGESGERSGARAAVAESGEREGEPAEEGGFEEISLFDLDEEEGEARAESAPRGRRGGRRRGGRRGRREARPSTSPPESESDDAEEPAEDDEETLGLAPEAPEIEEDVEATYDEDELREEPLSAAERLRLERERRRLARVAKAGPDTEVYDAGESDSESEDLDEPKRLPRGRAALLVRADPDAIFAGIVLARELRQLEGIWIYPQEELMTFFRSVCTDLRENTPIYVIGFEARPARDAIQAAALYSGRLVWFDDHLWAPEDVGAMSEALGAGMLELAPGTDSVLPLVLERGSRRSRFTDKLVDLATGRFTQHDFERWGRLWWSRVVGLAARTGEHRSDLEPLLAGRPSDLAREAARVPPPPPPPEVDWVARNDFRLVHFGGLSMVTLELPDGLHTHLAARIARERYGAELSLARREGGSTYALATDDVSGRRALDVGALLDHLDSKFSWAEALAGTDHVARLRIEDLARRPERDDELLSEIAMGRSILEG